MEQLTLKTLTYAYQKNMLHLILMPEHQSTEIELFHPSVKMDTKEKFYKLVSDTIQRGMDITPCSDRKAKNIRFRQFVYYYCYKYGKMSYSELGRLTGFDHATVIHAIRKLEGYIEIEPDTRKEVEHYKRLLGL